MYVYARARIEHEIVSNKNTTKNTYNVINTVMLSRILRCIQCHCHHRKRCARESGVDAGRLEDADDADKPKEAVVALIVAAMQTAVRLLERLRSTTCMAAWRVWLDTGGLSHTRHTTRGSKCMVVISCICTPCMAGALSNPG